MMSVAAFRAPFTEAEFLRVFEEYNNGIWPAQVVLSVLAIGAVVGCFLWRSTTWQRVAGVILGMFWLWSGAVYHLMHFARINRAAYLFGILFVVNGLLILVREAPLGIGEAPASRLLLGSFMIGYALVAYPALAYSLGHKYPFMPTFGAPCPLAIFTLGLLITIRPPVPLSLVAIPIAWSAIATIAALQFGMYEDFGLVAAGVAVLFVVLSDRFMTRKPRFECEC